MCCFICSLKGQAKFLESKLNAFYRFDGNLTDFSLWLNKAETALQSFNDITEEGALTPTGSEGMGLWKPVRVDVSFDIVTVILTVIIVNFNLGFDNCFSGRTEVTKELIFLLLNLLFF